MNSVVASSFTDLSDLRRVLDLHSEYGAELLEQLTDQLVLLTPNPERAKELLIATILAADEHVLNKGRLPTNDLRQWLIDKATTLAGESKSNEMPPSINDPAITLKLGEYWDETHEQLTSYVRRKYHRELADAEDIVANDFQRLNEHVKKLESDGETAVWAFLNNRNRVRGWLFTTANILSCCMYREVARIKQTLDTLENLLRDEFERHCSHTFDFDDAEPHLKECSPHEQEVISKLANDNPSVVAKGYGVARSTIWRIRNNVRERITAGMRQQELFRHLD